MNPRFPRMCQSWSKLACQHRTEHGAGVAVKCLFSFSSLAAVSRGVCSRRPVVLLTFLLSHLVWRCHCGLIESQKSNWLWGGWMIWDIFRNFKSSFFTWIKHEIERTVWKRLFIMWLTLFVNLWMDSHYRRKRVYTFWDIYDPSSSKGILCSYPVC